jgi:O-antigen ligase
MSTRISHIPFYGRMPIRDKTLFVWTLAFAVILAAVMYWKPMFGIAFGLAPLVLLLVSHGQSVIYLLIAATFLFLPMDVGLVLLPADIVAAVLVAAYLLDVLVRGPSRHGNPLARPFFLYTGVVLLSIALEGFTALSVRYLLRQILLLATFLAVAHFGHRIKVKRVLLVFMAAAIANSCYSVMQFLALGGSTRAFGLAGRGYGDHAMLGFLISVIFYLWSSDIRSRIFWGFSSLLMVGAVAATQTRASALTAVWGLVVIIPLALRAGKRLLNNVPRKGLWAAIVLGILILPVLVLYTPLFEGIMDRFARMGFQATGTILLRLSLWKAALAAFWANPIFGIGAGNFAQVANWVPGVRFDPIFYHVSGLSTHVVIISALTETGLVGLAALLYFFARAVKISYRDFAATAHGNDIPDTLSLFTIALVILGSSLYAGAWFWGNNSYHMAVFFGLMVSHRARPTPFYPRET